MGRTKNQVDQGVVALFAQELERLRGETGLTQDELADLAQVGRSTVGAYERGERPPSLPSATRLDRALKEALKEQKREQEVRSNLLDVFPKRGVAHRRRYNLREYVDLEKRAITLDQFHPQVVPGQLQTEDYARADLAATVPPQTVAELKELLRVRMERQKQVLGRNRPLSAQFIVDEGALRREIGGPQVMADQVKHIITKAESSPFVTVQVLPFSAGAHAALHGACTLLGMSPSDSLLYVETMAGGQTLNDPTLVAVAAQRFGALRASALSPSESLAWLRNFAEGTR